MVEKKGRKRKERQELEQTKFPRVPGNILRNCIFLDDFVIPKSSMSNFMLQEGTNVSFNSEPFYY